MEKLVKKSISKKTFKEINTQSEGGEGRFFY